jgi:hypothetical protein
MNEGNVLGQDIKGARAVFCSVLCPNCSQENYPRNVMTGISCINERPMAVHQKSEYL